MASIARVRLGLQIDGSMLVRDIGKEVLKSHFLKLIKDAMVTSGFQDVIVDIDDIKILSASRRASLDEVIKHIEGRGWRWELGNYNSVTGRHTAEVFPMDEQSPEAENRSQDGEGDNPADALLDAYQNVLISQGIGEKVTIPEV